MGQDIQTWRVNAQELLRGKPWSLKFIKTFQEIVKYIEANQWQGACHAISSVLYILLAEQGIQSTLCIGEVISDTIAFDHSWIEIDDDIYDIAVINTLDDRFRFPPTIRGFDVATRMPTKLKYGVSTGLADDESTIQVKRMGFSTYMDNFPNHRDGLWGIAAIIGNKLGITTDVAALKTRYAQTQWIFKG